MRSSQTVLFGSTSLTFLNFSDLIVFSAIVKVGSILTKTALFSLAIFLIAVSEFLKSFCDSGHGP